MAAHAMARETVAALRRKIARIEGRLAERLEVDEDAQGDSTLLRRGGVAADEPLRLGIPDFDRALGGGIPRAGLTEIHATAMRDAASAAGFALALTSLSAAPAPVRPVLWIAASELFHEAGHPYAPGILQRYGLAPARLLIAEPPRPLDALWIAEEAANAACFSAILLEVAGDPRALDLTATRRLHRRALLAGHPIFLLRQAGHAQPTASPLRLAIASASSTPRRALSGALDGSIGPPAFRVTIDKNRTASPASVTLEWTHGAFQERQFAGAAFSRALVPLSSGGAGDAPAPGQVMALATAGHGSAARLQPAREQHPAHRRHRRAS